MTTSGSICFNFAMLMKKVFFLIFPLLSAAVSCVNHDTGMHSYQHNFDSLMDTLLPYFANLHDSIPEERRFDTVYAEFMKVHKSERLYKWLGYKEQPDGYAYFLITRLEPSMKNDKFSAICGRFKRDANGNFSGNDYEELFWTWKMREDEMSEKALKLFSMAIEGQDLSRYTPEVSDGEWIEFPGNGVTYDKSLKTWVKK